MTTDKEIVLFATLYHYESIIHSLKELQNVKTLVIFVDKEDTTQKNSFEVIEKITKISKIKIEKETLDVANFASMIKTIDKLVKKHKACDIYVDVTHSVRTQTIGLITYFTVKYPQNFKKMTFYASWMNEVVEIPIFKAERLIEVEMKCINFISKNNMFMINDLAKHLGVSVTHTYRILNKLEAENYLSKVEGSWKLTMKGEIVNDGK